MFSVRKGLFLSIISLSCHHGALMCTQKVIDDSTMMIMMMMMIKGQTALILFYFIFAMVAQVCFTICHVCFFECKNKTFSSGLGSKKSSRLGHSLARSPLWHLGHYSNVFNWKSNVIVTLSEHVDGNFQARCGQRLQSTNHVVLRATISPWLSRREAYQSINPLTCNNQSEKGHVGVYGQWLS